MFSTFAARSKSHRVGHRKKVKGGALKKSAKRKKKAPAKRKKNASGKRKTCPRGTRWVDRMMVATKPFGRPRPRVQRCVAKGVGSRRAVYDGKRKRTSGGLKQHDLMYNHFTGRIVSLKRHNNAMRLKGKDGLTASQRIRKFQTHPKVVAQRNKMKRGEMAHRGKGAIARRIRGGAAARAAPAAAAKRKRAKRVVAPSTRALRSAPTHARLRTERALRFIDHDLDRPPY